MQHARMHDASLSLSPMALRYSTVYTLGTHNCRLWTVRSRHLPHVLAVAVRCSARSLGARLRRDPLQPLAQLAVAVRLQLRVRAG